MSETSSDSDPELYSTEYLYSMDNNCTYVSCHVLESNVNGEPYDCPYQYEKCDVFQVFNIKTDNPSVAFNNLQHLICLTGSEVYAMRVDTTDDFDNPLSSTWPQEGITAWTSKEAYDKWHLVNDQILQDTVLANEIFVNLNVKEGTIFHMRI